MTLQRFQIIGLAVMVVSAVTVWVVLPATPGDDSRYGLLALVMFVLPGVMMSTGRGDAELDGEDPHDGAPRPPGSHRDGPHRKSREFK